MYVPCILYSLLSRPTNAQHTYVVTPFYISSVHVSMHPHHLQTVLSLYFAKVLRIIKVTNSINSLDYNVYMIPVLCFLYACIHSHYCIPHPHLVCTSQLVNVITTNISVETYMGTRRLQCRKIQVQTPRFGANLPAACRQVGIVGWKTIIGADCGPVAIMELTSEDAVLLLIA